MTDPVQPLLPERLAALAAALPKGHRVLVIPHDFPDPDAMASAAAVHFLLERALGIRSVIAFRGEVSRAENREMLRRLKCRWHRVEALSDLRQPACVLVDTAPWSRNVTLPASARVLAVFDHHEHALPPQALPFQEIRAGAGATTTILYEYLKLAGLEPPRWLAAVMAYAIASETLDLSREAGPDDLKAYTELIAMADLRVIGKIRHAPLVRVYFARLQEALAEARTLKDVAWTHLNRTEQPEVVAEIADLLLRMEGIRWSFCTANLNGHLFVSVRSRRPGSHCARLLRRAIGKRGAAGGHDQMAAGYLEVGHLSGFDREEKRLDLARMLVSRMAGRLAGGRDAVDDLSRRVVE